MTANGMTSKMKDFDICMASLNLSISYFLLQNNYQQIYKQEAVSGAQLHAMHLHTMRCGTKFDGFNS